MQGFPFFVAWMQPVNRQQGVVGDHLCWSRSRRLWSRSACMVAGLVDVVLLQGVGVEHHTVGKTIRSADGQLLDVPRLEGESALGLVAAFNMWGRARAQV